MHQARLAFTCNDAAQARLLHSVLEAEAQGGPDGSEVRLSVEGPEVHAVVQAVDVATLRAAFNSVARQADTALRTFAAGSAAP